MLSELPPDLTGAYFQPAGVDLQVVERARRLVAFTELDLSRQRPLRRDYHLILCRNVVIYFDRATQERLFQVFTDSLAPGGYLVLGKVETLFGPARERLQLIDPPRADLPEAGVSARQKIVRVGRPPGGRHGRDADHRRTGQLRRDRALRRGRPDRWDGARAAALRPGSVGTTATRPSFPRRRCHGCWS
jgi:hypothetical protein